MCGIFSYLGKNFSFEDLVVLSNKIKHRGPDSSNNISLYFDDKQFFLGFHRLAINGLDEISNQPLKDDDNEIYLIANAEIFNYKELIKENGFDYKTYFNINNNTFLDFEGNTCTGFFYVGPTKITNFFDIKDFNFKDVSNNSLFNLNLNNYINK